MRIRNKTGSFTGPSFTGPPGRAGFSMIEVLLGVLVLVVAVLGTMASITSAAMVGRSTRETTIAHKAAQRMLERMHGMPCSQVVGTFNTQPNDDPGGANTAPGPNFAVPGLDVRDGDPDGFAGEVLLPLGFPDSKIEEDMVDPSFGMPRDLNGDGVVDGVDHAGDYIIMPVRVRVEWTGTSGERAVEIESILAR